jgi:hypothetical protein
MATRYFELCSCELEQWSATQQYGHHLLMYEFPMAGQTTVHDDRVCRNSNRSKPSRRCQDYSRGQGLCLGDQLLARQQLQFFCQLLDRQTLLSWSDI